MSASFDVSLVLCGSEQNQRPSVLDVILISGYYIAYAVPFVPEGYERLHHPSKGTIAYMYLATPLLLTPSRLNRKKTLKKWFSCASEGDY